MGALGKAILRRAAGINVDGLDLLDGQPPLDFLGDARDHPNSWAAAASSPSKLLKTVWLDRERAAVAWGDRKGELAFDAAADEKTSVQISRASAVLVNPGKPIPLLAEGK